MNKLIVSLFILFVLAACRNASPISIQGRWILISYDSPSNQIAAVPDVDAWIEFDSEGRMTGNVGCNGFGGNYSVKVDTISFDPIESTLMFCDGPVGEQEMAVLSVFQENATFVMDGDTVTITSTDGNSVVVLERK